VKEYCFPLGGANFTRKFYRFTQDMYLLGTRKNREQKQQHIGQFEQSGVHKN
jgi:hypothetical protein